MASKKLITWVSNPRERKLNGLDFMQVNLLVLSDAIIVVPKGYELKFMPYSTLTSKQPHDP